MTDRSVGVAALQARAEAATPGPWEETVWVNEHEGGNAAVGPFHPCGADGDEGPGGESWTASERDAAFIAAARTDVPVLLDALAEAERERDMAQHDAQTWVEALNSERAQAQALQGAVRTFLAECEIRLLAVPYEHHHAMARFEALRKALR